MGAYEDEIREAIKARFGSIPKMSEATGIAKNTIYHALERGLDNTTTRTRRQILDALSNDEQKQSVDNLTVDEYELITLYRNMDAHHKELMIESARSFSALSVKDEAGIREDVGRTELIMS